MYRTVYRREGTWEGRADYERCYGRKKEGRKCDYCEELEVQTSVEKKMHDGEDFTDGRSGFAVRRS